MAMRTTRDLLGVRGLVGANELKPTVILLFSATVLAVHRHFGSIEAGTRLLQPDNGLAAPLFMFAGAFLLLGVLPLALVVHLFRERPAGYGLCMGDWRTGLRSVGVLFPLITVALLLPGSQTAEMRGFYPFAPEAARSATGFAMLQVPRILLFYTAWEFFFRGFMLFGLRRSVGDWLAICIQTIPSCLWHIGMPSGELLSSIAGGILFGVMALRTNSIVWPFLLHVLIGVGFDALIVLPR
jgi:membrane protease YdiL (CAAX protease family)